MSELNLIKTVLFNAANLNDALTRLTELGIQYRACSFTDNGFHITGHDVTFWPTQSLRCPLAVCINGNLFDYDDRRSFLAGQCETVETPVPAASPDTTGQRPVTCSCLHNCDCPSVDLHPLRKCYGSMVNRSPYNAVFKFNLPAIRQTIRTERRLKNSRVKGLSS